MTFPPDYYREVLEDAQGNTIIDEICPLRTATTALLHDLLWHSKSKLPV
ncbi:MAG: hypothetical protein O4861_00760 [Trichodesmium sp. St16_bin4-tuft]|nr:hypothetical protein [Trichodesmium sp. MAG_R01]MDE5070820.1 hypothetical protein [Trichodesmium sp. St5_bin8]MDE5092167.1 hypothetical protein [Trichodesmium sp. St18_bin3_1_1]MDE5096947.1 hypothetical protein [Trichodesmium sp. St16_bin4-tuft]